MSEPIVLRVPPSGMIAGDENNPPLAGGTADPPDGSKATGRVWIYVGAGAPAQVPGSATAAAAAGLDVLPVDLRRGYSYDFDCDMAVFGTLTTLTNYTQAIEISEDGGGTYASFASQIHFTDLGTDDTGRLRQYIKGADLMPPGATVDHVRVMLQRHDADAGAAMQYVPTLVTLKITEYSG